jgi:hypothetical protein
MELFIFGSVFGAQVLLAAQMVEYVMEMESRRRPPAGPTL